MNIESNSGLYTQEQLDEAVRDAVENRAGATMVGFLLWCLPALVFGLAVGYLIGKP